VNSGISGITACDKVGVPSQVVGSVAGSEKVKGLVVFDSKQ
jgi:hypothetical protein